MNLTCRHIPLYIKNLNTRNAGVSMYTFFQSIMKGENPVNWAITIASISLGFIAWLHQPTDTVSIHYLIIAVIFALLTIAKLSFFAFTTHKENIFLKTKNIELLDASLPKIKSYLEQSGKNIIVATKSPLFTVGTVVTIVYAHHDKGGYEQPLCTGRIGHIQSEHSIMQIYIDDNDIFKKNKIFIKSASTVKESFINFKIYPGIMREE